MGCGCIMQTSYNNTQPHFAGFFARFAAFLIDTICVGALLLAMRFSLTTFLNALGGDAATAPILFNYSFLDVSLYLLKVVYFVLITYFTGTTIGKKLFNLRVVNATGESLSFFSILYRETIGRFFSGFFCSLGYIMIGIDKEKRGIHDFLGDTRVVYTVRSTAPPVPTEVTLQQGQQTPTEAMLQQEQLIPTEVMLQQEQPIPTEAMLQQEQPIPTEAVLQQEQPIPTETVLQQEQQEAVTIATADIESGYTDET